MSADEQDAAAWWEARQAESRAAMAELAGHETTYLLLVRLTDGSGDRDDGNLDADPDTGANCLTLTIVAGGLGEPHQPRPIDPTKPPDVQESDAAIERLLAKSRPILHDWSCPIFQVQFDDYALYTVFNESCGPYLKADVIAYPPSADAYGNIRERVSSVLLDLANESCSIYLMTRKVECMRHFSVWTSDHVVHVVSAWPPLCRRIRPEGFAALGFPSPS